MKLVVIGTGHIGLITALAFTLKGHEVLCVDSDRERINQLSEGHSFIFEPDVEVTLRRAIEKKQIQFTDHLSHAMSFSKFQFIAVGAPTLADKSVNLDSVYSILESFQNSCSGADYIFIIKSTLPPGTMKNLSRKYAQFQFVSNPEFLREGCALKDSLTPDRIIIGTQNLHLAEQIKTIYRNFYQEDSQVLVMPPNSAELSKYAANTFLAARISLMNEFSSLCEKYEANIDDLRRVVGSDHRLGNHYLDAGLGYGGSCFPKDLDALVQLAHEKEVNLFVTEAVQKTNQNQLSRFIQGLDKTITSGSTLTVWGISFKPNTNDLREAPAVKIIQHFLDRNCIVHCHDPQSLDSLKKELKAHPFFKNIKFFSNSYDALQNSQALVIATEWDEYRNSDLEKIKKYLGAAPIVDGRNIFSPQKMRQAQLNYSSIGRLT